LRSVVSGRQPAVFFLWPFFVVLAMPASDDCYGMGEAHEPVLVQAFISKTAVERLDVGVLVRFAGLDLLELNTIVVPSSASPC